MDSYGSLRSIRDDEIELVRTWRNAPSVRANMYTSHEIGADEHRSWWSQVQRRDDQAYFMYEVGGVPIGVVDFTVSDPFIRNAYWACY